MSPAREHGGDLVPVKLIGLLSIVARLRGYLPERALEEL